jgi:CHAD domain-containing protein
MRLRYASEMAAPALGDPWRAVAERCEAVQDLLGEHQDTVVSRSTLRELGVQAHLSGENGFTFGRLHALEQVRAADAEREFSQVVGDGLPKKAAGWG